LAVKSRRLVSIIERGSDDAVDGFLVTVTMVGGGVYCDKIP
jgi:hypothetical protein